MKPIDFDGRNAVLGAPKGQEDEVVPLPVHRTEMGIIISCWELTDDEIAKIRLTGRIWLSVWSGETQPPVGIGVSRPPELGVKP